MILAGIVGAAVLMGLIPAWRAYHNSLADGLTIRV
jgi:putative ABC transport system permease protein